MTKKKSLLTTLSILGFSVALPVALMGGLPISTAGASTVYNEWNESVSITNSSFNSISSTYYEGDVTGWTRKWGNTGAKTMIIDVQNKFDTYFRSTYYLTSNPGKVGNDNKILMINSSTTNPTSEKFTPQEKSEGYVSNSISLSANSYYEFQVSMKTASFNEAQEFASIYISGLTDEDGNAIDFSVEGQTASTWQTYYFYIATGSEAQSITIDLWLGTQEHPSTGVAFFDEVKGTKLSQNAYYQNMQHKDQQGNQYLQTSIADRTIIDTDELNFNFEKSLEGSINQLVDWTKSDSSINGHARILYLNDGSFKDATGFEYPGSDFSANNTQAMVLWANNGNVSVKSLPLQINSLGLYKITMHAKTSGLESGNFTVTATETSSIKDEFTYLENYQPKSATSSALTEGSDKFINNYSELVFYVQGHDRYNSQIQLSLNLGSAETAATGAVIIDNITVELVSNEDFSTDGNLLQLQVATASETSIANGYFNKANNADNKLTLPVAPADWTITKSNLTNKQEAGIINIYAPYFDEYNFYWKDGLANPGSPDKYSSTADVNNILMMYNQRSDYQTLTSSTFSLSANTYYNLSFDFRTYGEEAKFNLKLVDEDGVVLLNKQNISNADWNKYECFINSGEASSNVQIIIEFGSQKDRSSGYAFFDNFQLQTSDEKAFENAQVQIDLSGFMLNLDPNNEITNSISSSNAFTGKVESGSSNAAKGGIIKGEGNDSFKYVNDNGETNSIDDGTLKNNVLIIQTDLASTYTISSVSKIDTEADKYYSLKFRLLTSFPSFDGKHIHDGEEVDTKFGVTIGLNEFDKIEALTSNNGWTEYTILFKASEAKETYFVFSLVSDCLDTTGYAYVTDISWNESDADTYNAAANSSEYNKTLFTSQIASSTDEEPEEPDDETTTTPSNNDETLWLLIPSLLLGVVLIFAIIMYALKHVKVKKSDKISKEKYDRTQSLNADLITNEAKEIQNAEIAQVDDHIAKLQTQLQELEEGNKQTISKSREQGKVTKTIERQFKVFAQKRATIQKSLDELNEHKAFIQTKDYLISIEKRILSNKKKQSKQTNNKK